MGMSASQARLLSLTSQMHSVEFKAQNIEAQKIALATQKDELYQRYCEALDATVITVAYNGADAQSVYMRANFSTVCGYSTDRAQEYLLKNNRTGNIIVSQNVKDAWEQTRGRDKYSFAWYAIGLDNNFGVVDSTTGSIYDESYAQIGIGTYTGTASEELSFTDSDGYTYAPVNMDDNSAYMTIAEWNAFEEILSTTPLNNKNDVDNLKEKYKAISSANGDVNAQKDALKEFRDYFYANFKEQIVYEMQTDNQDQSGGNSVKFSDNEWENSLNGQFEYYCRIFDEIKAAGGCEAIDPQYESGEEGTQWFNNMVKAGLVGIRTFDDNKKSWTDTSIATSVSANYLREEQDTTDLKKAEALYEHELNIIKAKDTKFDNELSKLETERTSIKTEIDSLKTIIKDNTDRTFGIFS